MINFQQIFQVTVIVYDLLLAFYSNHGRQYLVLFRNVHVYTFRFIKNCKYFHTIYAFNVPL